MSNQDLMAEFNKSIDDCLVTLGIDQFDDVEFFRRRVFKYLHPETGYVDSLLVNTILGVDAVQLKMQFRKGATQAQKREAVEEIQTSLGYVMHINLGRKAQKDPQQNNAPNQPDLDQPSQPEILNHTLKPAVVFKSKGGAMEVFAQEMEEYLANMGLSNFDDIEMFKDKLIEYVNPRSGCVQGFSLGPIDASGQMDLKLTFERGTSSERSQEIFDDMNSCLSYILYINLHNKKSPDQGQNNTSNQSNSDSSPQP